MPLSNLKPLSSSDANVDSGIKLTMLRCTFYRNFCGFMTAGLLVTDAWPFVAQMADNTYVHNDAIILVADVFWWDPPTGPELRTGAASVTATGNHYDGGWTSAGVFGYNTIPTTVWVTGSGPDEADAAWNSKWEQATWVDHGAFEINVLIFQVYPALPDKQLARNHELIDSSIEGHVNIPGSGGAAGEFDGNIIYYSGASGSWLTQRCRFARNAADGTTGLGGIDIRPPPGGSLTPTNAFEDTEWTDNLGGSGPAIFVYYGQVDLRFRRCFFRYNVARLSGGAIYVLGSQALTMTIAESAFDSNALRPPPDAPPVDVTVRVNTGGFAIDPNTDLADNTVETYLPIWRIDDGPVYGIPWEMCQRAMQSSLTAVSRGFPSSWPSDLPCANVSYSGPNKPFNHVVSLPAGTHTLWTGLMMETPLQSTGWMQAWIEIADTIGPLFPPIPEVRAEQFPGCIFGACGDGSCLDVASNMCPRGIAMWSTSEFQVSSGQGGAISSSGPIAMLISDSTFRANEAPKGAALSVAAASSVRITNTTIDTPADESSSAVWTKAASVATCAENPCEAGSQCTFVDSSTFCEPCAENEFGVDGISCDACRPGTQPDDAHIQCDPCEPGQYSQIGVCIFCPAGKTSSEDQTGCTPCEPGTHRAGEEPTCEQCPDGTHSSDGVDCVACQPGTSPTDTRDECVACEAGKSSSGRQCQSCPEGTRSADDKASCVNCLPGTRPTDAQDGCVACDAGKHSTNGLECQVCPPGQQPNEFQTACERCIGNAFSPDGQACRDCPARNAPNDERTDCFCQANTYGAQELGLVTCFGSTSRSDGMETDECAVCPACLDCSVVGTTTLKGGWAFFGADGKAYRCPGADKDFEACPPLNINENTTMDQSTCAVGYEGPVCGNCEDEYNHLKVGNPCEPCDDGVINVSLLLGLFVGTLIVGAAVISGALGVLQDFGVITDLRILVGFYQILGQAGNVLDIVFPYPVPELVDFIKLLFLDVRKVVMLDCWDIGGFYGKITTNIVAVPTILVGVCVLIYISQKRTLMVVIAAGAADESGLETLKVKLKQNLFVGIFLVYPTITTTLFRVPQCKDFGEDASFHEDDYTIDCNATKFTLTVAFAIVVIILIPIGVPAIFTILMLRAKQSIGGVVNETALGGAKLAPDDADDEDDTYGFLISDYRPQYWYHEIVTYSRKLILGGISVVMGRGTMAQTYFVISAEAFYLMHHMRTYPFVVYKHNVMEALGHCALMLLYAISLILRNDDQGDWDAEWFPKQGYGWFIVFLFAVLLPSPTFYFYCRDKDKLIASGSEVGEGFETNPLAIELGESAEDDKDSAYQPTAQPARAKLAKMQREGKDSRAQVQKLQTETQQQQAEIQKLQEEIQQLQEENQQLEAHGQMDGDTVRRSEAALRKKVAALEAQLAAVHVPHRAGTEMVAVSDGGSAATVTEHEPKTQADTMKELAADESLSEDARESAKKALEVLVSSQLADIEQTASRKKRAGTLKDLESDARFANQQAQIEQNAALEKEEAEVKTLVAQAELRRKRQEAESKNLEAEAQADLFMDEQQQHALQKLQAKAKLMDQKAQACQQLESVTKGVSEEMTEWLAANRLQEYAAHMALVAGSSVAPSDLQFFTDKDVQQIASVMTPIEKMRLQTALKGLREDGQAADAE